MKSGYVEYKALIKKRYFEKSWCYTKNRYVSFSCGTGNSTSTVVPFLACFQFLWAMRKSLVTILITDLASGLNFGAKMV